MLKDLLKHGIKWDKFTLATDDIDSSMINVIGVADTDLFVQFANNKWYKAQGAATEYDEIVYADSAGKYYHSNIKNDYSVFEILDDGTERLTNGA